MASARMQSLLYPTFPFPDGNPWAEDEEELLEYVGLLEDGDSAAEEDIARIITALQRDAVESSDGLLRALASDLPQRCRELCVEANVLRALPEAEYRTMVYGSTSAFAAFGRLLLQRPLQPHLIIRTDRDVDFSAVRADARRFLEPRLDRLVEEDDIAYDLVATALDAREFRISVCLEGIPAVNAVPLLQEYAGRLERRNLYFPPNDSR